MDNFPEFRGFKKIARLSRDIIITEKIDGTSGLIYIDEKNNIFVGSRNQWLWGSIEPDKMINNHGFGVWAHRNQDELRQLGKGYHYGEWWGKGIQRGYGLEEKRFSLFNVSRWCMWNETPKLISVDPKTNAEKYQDKAPQCCYIVPVLYNGMFDMLAIGLCLERLALEGSVASPGFAPAEGIVIFHTHAGIMFKKTLVGDEKGKVDQ